MDSTAPMDKSKIWLRFAGFFVGLAVFLWLPGEESSEIGAVVIAALICTWLAAMLFFKISPGDKNLFLKHIFIGIGYGLLIAPMGIFLMAMKTGLHGNGIPDFTIHQLQSVLSRMPYYLVAGFMLGAGIGLLRSKIL
ncbi:MAG: hypothetical protein ACK2UM_14385 [Anaerolineales bacterium]|jgi:hypothetical protein